jgi:hypothetical protein
VRSELLRLLRELVRPGTWPEALAVGAAVGIGVFVVTYFF